MGVTGERNSLATSSSVLAKRLKLLTDKPVIMGFGISGPEQAVAAAEHADGVVVASALMRPPSTVHCPTRSLSGLGRSGRRSTGANCREGCLAISAVLGAAEESGFAPQRRILQPDFHPTDNSSPPKNGLRRPGFGAPASAPRLRRPGSLDVDLGRVSAPTRLSAPLWHGIKQNRAARLAPRFPVPASWAAGSPAPPHRCPSSASLIHALGFFSP